MDGKNPCDLCKRDDCDECSLRVFALKYECTTYECMLNYEGMCLIGFYEKCGAWED